MKRFNKNEWKKVRLEECAYINMGQSPASSTYNVEQKGIPFYQGNADFGELYPSIKYYCINPIKTANSGDLLLSVRAPVGKINIATSYCCIGRGLCAIQAKENKCYQKYLYYVLKSREKEFNMKGNGSTFKSINKNQILETSFYLPNLEIQKKIILRLDNILKILNKKKQQLLELEKLSKCLFYSMFGDLENNEKKWDKKTFGDICKVSQGLQIPISARKNQPGKNRYVYITIQYLNGSKDAEYIENPKSNVICNKNDILMTRTGNTGMVITNVEGVFHNNFFIVNFDRNILIKEYLIFCLDSREIQGEIKKRAGSSTIPDLNHGEFYKINIMLPPIELQNKFAERIRLIEKSKFEIQQSIDETQKLFDSLMEKYFG